MNRTVIRILCLVLSLSLCIGFAGCSIDSDAIAEKALESIAENEKIQSWLQEQDLDQLSNEAIAKFKESIPILKEFLSREDVQEKFKTVGLPLIKEFLNYTGESMKLKAETLGNIIRIFAPDLTEAVDEIFASAPTETTVPEN